MSHPGPSRARERGQLWTHRAPPTAHLPSGSSTYGKTGQCPDRTRAGQNMSSRTSAPSRALPGTHETGRGPHLSVRVLVDFVIPRTVVALDEREILLLLPLQRGRSSVHVGRKVTLGERDGKKDVRLTRSRRGKTEAKQAHTLRDAAGRGTRDEGWEGTQLTVRERPTRSSAPDGLDLAEAPRRGRTQRSPGAGLTAEPHASVPRRTRGLRRRLTATRVRAAPGWLLKRGTACEALACESSARSLRVPRPRATPALPWADVGPPAWPRTRLPFVPRDTHFAKCSPSTGATRRACPWRVLLRSRGTRAPRVPAAPRPGQHWAPPPSSRRSDASVAAPAFPRTLLHVAVPP